MTVTTSDLAYRDIRSMLTGGELQPGQRLSQCRLARKLGCSTVPVVEALRRLESEGLLVKQSRKMACVRKLSSSDVEGLYLLREALEAITARLCAQRITPEEAKTLQTLSHEYEKAWQANELEPDADVAIHRHIAECARCPLLVEELNRYLLIERTAGRFHANPATKPGHPHTHRAVVQAIMDHNIDAAEYMMKKHIQNGLQETLRELARQEKRPKRKPKTESPT